MHQRSGFKGGVSEARVARRAAALTVITDVGCHPGQKSEADGGGGEVAVEVAHGIHDIEPVSREYVMVGRVEIHLKPEANC
jgi:hypothetical protein